MRSACIGRASGVRQYLSDAEVCDLWCPAGLPEHVAGLDVAVHDLLLAPDRIEAARDAFGYLGYLSRCRGLWMRLDERAQRPIGDVLHHQADAVRTEIDSLHDLDDVRM